MGPIFDINSKKHNIWAGSELYIIECIIEIL